MCLLMAGSIFVCSPTHRQFRSVFNGRPTEDGTLFVVAFDDGLFRSTDGETPSQGSARDDIAPQTQACRMCVGRPVA
jgi:hypothetical protein